MNDRRGIPIVRKKSRERTPDGAHAAQLRERAASTAVESLAVECPSRERRSSQPMRRKNMF